MYVILCNKNLTWPTFLILHSIKESILQNFAQNFAHQSIEKVLYKFHMQRVRRSSTSGNIRYASGEESCYLQELARQAARQEMAT